MAVRLTQDYVEEMVSKGGLEDKLTQLYVEAAKTVSATTRMTDHYVEVLWFGGTVTPPTPTPSTSRLIVFIGA